MALKTDQAKVLRRRVLGGLARNLILFTAAFLVVGLVLEALVVPRIAEEVADSTSVWRPLNSTEQFNTALAEYGLVGTDLFTSEVQGMEKEGFSNETGSISAATAELDALSQAMEEYTAAVAAGTPPSEAARAVLEAYLQDTALYTIVDAQIGDVESNNSDAIKVETNGVEDAPGANANGSAATDGDVGTDTAATDGDANADTATDAILSSSDGEPAVPFITYDAILSGAGIDPSEASTAQGFAALRVSARIQELGLVLDVPLGIETDPVAIMTNAALLGMDNAELYDILDAVYPTSQAEAYSQWTVLPPADQARAVGLSASEPVWQVEHSTNGTYEVRDIATYTFVKSFKLPLALIVFVAGWLIIVFRALNRSLRYFDALSEAVGKVIGDKDAPIELPQDLSIARNELAVIRSQSLADERAAKAAEQRKNELVAYLAHDIRTPLTSVLGYLDLLRETTDLPRDTLRKYADVAYSKAERLESLINEFFEITRYNLSAIPIERETVGVRLFCQQVAESFFPEASARHIRISVDVGAADQFFVDPDKLARALGNVLRNAVAYADTHSVIALAARQDARFTTITVANRGREISEAHLQSIFEKFYREDGARATRSGGAGLGLAIAKEIVVAHQGEIEAASERGVTVFTLRIPTRPETEGAPAVDGGAPRREGLRAMGNGSAGASRAPSLSGTSRTPGASPTAAANTAERAGGTQGATVPLGTAPLKPCNARHGRPARRAPMSNNRTIPQPRHTRRQP